MDLKRFFCDTKIDGDVAYLTGDEFYHAVKVTRHKVGYKLVLCDNGNKDYYATVKEVNKDNLVAFIDSIVDNEVESDFFARLFIGNCKELDTVVQKAVELGIKEIVPFTSAHCNVSNLNLERMQKIVLESSKQCGRSSLAIVKELMTFDEALDYAKDDTIITFYEYERINKVKDLRLDKNKPISLFIGCEGGFSLEEVDRFNKIGANICTLGKRILRVSTAVVSACTLMNEKLDD